jgi:hypothetical protein
MYSAVSRWVFDECVGDVGPCLCVHDPLGCCRKHAHTMTPTIMSPTAQQSQSLHEFLHTIPAPVISVLVGLGPYVQPIRRALEIVSWKPAGKTPAKTSSSSAAAVATTTPIPAAWPDGWLVVGIWWLICLCASPVLR